VKDVLLAWARRQPAPARLNAAREWLQAAMLKSLERQGAMAALAFHGGTALRFLYDIGRYSEDLDFAWHGAAAATDRIAPWLERVKSDLWNLAIGARVALARRPRIAEARFDFRAVAQELEVPALSVKVEIGLDVPASAVLESAIVSRVQTFRVRHHDRATLLAGKLHAVLQRHYAKGRDFYDLLWYLGDPRWPGPNLTFLNEALRRTGWKGADLAPDTWRSAALDRLGRVDWAAARKDVQPFLEDPDEARLLTLDALRNALETSPRHRGGGAPS